MGINRLLIDSCIQGFWHGHTKTGRDREKWAGHAAGPGTPACSGMCIGYLLCHYCPFCKLILK